MRAIVVLVCLLTLVGGSETAAAENPPGQRVCEPDGSVCEPSPEVSVCVKNGTVHPGEAC